MKYNTQIRIINSVICGWVGLGFMRGINSYNYNIAKQKETKMYLDKIIWGVGSVVFYINPVTFFYALYKEIYRLEVNLRGIEEEKNTRYYNEVR